MKTCGFSLVEAMMAAAIIAIGLTAAASLVGALMAKEELNTVSLRAANLHEQAIALYRLGLSPARIREILPESCVDGTPSSAGTFGLTFGSPTAAVSQVTGGSSFTVRTVISTLTYPVMTPNGGTLSYVSNPMTIVLPSTVWPVP